MDKLIDLTTDDGKNTVDNLKVIYNTFLEEKYDKEHGKTLLIFVIANENASQTNLSKLVVVNENLDFLDEYYENERIISDEYYDETNNQMLWLEGHKNHKKYGDTITEETFSDSIFFSTAEPCLHAGILMKLFLNHDNIHTKTNKFNPSLLMKGKNYIKKVYTITLEHYNIISRAKFLYLPQTVKVDFDDVVISKQFPIRTLFIYYSKGSINEESKITLKLWKLFSRFGTIHTHGFRYNGGFVIYKNEIEASNAQKNLNGSTFLNTILSVQFEKEKLDK